MAGGIRPGPIDDLGPPIVIDDGTLARAETALPGPIGLEAQGGSGKTTLAPLGDQVVAFARGKIGQCVGNGECFDLADQALRSAGAKSAADFGKRPVSTFLLSGMPPPTEVSRSPLVLPAMNLTNLRPASCLPDHEVTPKTALSTPLKLPVSDRVMLFDDSTAGLMRMNAARLEALGLTPPPEIAPLIRSLPPIADRPIIFTDSILATSFVRSRVMVELPANPSTEWREAAAKLPLDRISRRIGKGGAASVQRADGSKATPASPAELAAAAGLAAP